MHLSSPQAKPSSATCLYGCVCPAMWQPGWEGWAVWLTGWEGPALPSSDTPEYRWIKSNLKLTKINIFSLLKTLCFKSAHTHEFHISVTKSGIWTTVFFRLSTTYGC